jgi:hypothetical protein
MSTLSSIFIPWLLHRRAETGQAKALKAQAVWSGIWRKRGPQRFLSSIDGVLGGHLPSQLPRFVDDSPGRTKPFALRRHPHEVTIPRETAIQKRGIFDVAVRRAK